MNYKCVEIPEPDFDASFTDEMVVTAYQDEEDFNPCMPDEYPNIRLAELEKKIDETTLQASEAYEAASNASDISELAKTTASAAVTEIVEHEATITNPHPTNTKQDFAEVNISGLKSDLNGGSVSADDYNWFKSVYASLVDGSVISWIKGLVTFVKSLTERVGVLEDSYLLKYVVPVDSVGFDLTHDRYGRPFSFTDGDLIEIAFRIDAWVNNGGDLNRLHWRVNGIDATIYNVANSFYNYMVTSGSAGMKSQYPILRLHFIGKELNYFIIDKYKNSNYVYGQNLYVGFTSGLNAEKITKLTFFTNLSTSLIPAGTEIIIKKL